MGTLLSLDAAFDTISRNVQPLQDFETVRLEDGSGRVTSSETKAPYALPAFDNTGVDGYAFRHSTLAALQIVGASFAGEPFEGEISHGQAVRIATGAVLPNGADSVVMQEDCLVKEKILTIKKLPFKGSNIRARGADVKEGAAVLPRGQILQPQQIALLGALGFKSAAVFRKIKIAIASTGLELKSQGSALESGQIIDTNSLMLRQMIGPLGDVTILDPLPDDYDQSCAALRRAAHHYDLIITSGGVSVGDRDHVHAALRDLGKIHFWKLAIRPGKPVIFGQIEKCLMIGLPGNPVSSFVTFLLIVKPVLSALTGRKTALPPAFKIPLASFLKKDVPLRCFPRARLDYASGQLCAVPYKDQSSNLFASLTDADGLLDLSEETGDLEAGALVSFRQLTGWIW